ncbi:phage gp6-like head-tail connector protein [Pseudomonas sp. AO-1]|uniref:head-tail connector protein n=1 Tax=Pseudomonas sp. AO-1 TaxID=2855434 RepID=UPI001C794DB4|nr:head-tail connector protein [Pseudomonas sp. AO-1]QXZ16098.1 phage gp6-like head-tail connector protein [Pseudomonas sp. AO-1]
MSVIPIERAMHHLLAEPEDQDLVQSQLDGAETAAASYLQRRFYADQAALAEAVASVPGDRSAARAIHAASIEAASDIEDLCDRESAVSDADFVLQEALDSCTAAARGMVINEAIAAACLLKLGDLFANREDSPELPIAAKNLLTPYRIRMGV